MLIRLRRISFIVAVAGLALSAGPVAAAGGPVQHDGARAQKEVALEYFPDDICGPRAGWTQFVTTYQWKYDELPDGSFNFVYVETGTYHTDFDDPSIPSEDSQFTGAQHGTLTRGGTQIYTSQWHDFPGSITIHEQVLFVQVDDEIQLDRYILRVDGCP
jgi:hypothetical protein